MNARVKIGHGNRLIHNRLSEFVGFADDLSGLQPAASQDNRERFGLMAASAATVKTGWATEFR